jgi:hypothetical protein
MTAAEPELVWAPPAQATFERMPPDVQQALFAEFPRMALRYQPLYHNGRPPHIDSVGTVTHMQVPVWGMWLRIDTGYLEDEGYPVLFINELDELTEREVQASIEALHARPDHFTA